MTGYCLSYELRLGVDMSRLAVCIFAVLLLPVAHSITIVYVPAVCGTTISVADSVQVESGTGLTYDNNVDCNFTVSVASPYLVLANLEKFELEPLRSGSCSDYVNLYDRADTNSASLHSSPLCGSSLTNTTYVSSGQQMTVHFVTDSTAVYLGFYVILSPATIAPCSGTQFSCNNSYCVPSTSACDNYDQCGDASDESNCTGTSADGSDGQTGLIVGLTLGFLALVLIGAFIANRVYRRNRWERFQDDHIHDHDLADPDSSYPVTHKYFRGIRGHPVNFGATDEKDVGSGGGGDGGEKKAMKVAEAVDGNC